MDSNSHGGGSSNSSSHDHCWPSKMQDWHLRSPWDWEGCTGLYSGGDNRYEKLPMAEWVCSEEGYNIGKELFRGTSMVHESSALSDQPLMAAAGNFTEVINDRSFSSKAQFGPLEVKIHPSSMAEGSVKSEGNGVLKGWLVEGVTNGGNFLGGGPEYSHSGQRNMVVVGLGGRNDNYHSANESPMRENISVIKDVQVDSLTCLKLGKRQYFGDGANPAKILHPVPGNSAGDCVYKKPRALPASTAQPPRCQVEGCNLVLAIAKEYHKRHKVCEMHSKAPKVIVLGIEQRFCQQCSRFHAISEFDDAKRSCRRRLAGHNERRRKNSLDSLANSGSQEEKRLIGVLGEKFPMGRYALPYLPSPGRALSLLSSQQPWMNSGACSLSGDLSSRSSAALRELIAENRAQSVSRYSEGQYDQRDSRSVRMLQQPIQEQQTQSQEEMGNCRFMPGLRSLENNGKVEYVEEEVKKHGGAIGSHAVVVRPTLDLMQQSNSLFALQSGRNRSSSSSSEEEECEIWKSFEGTHIT